MKHRFSSSLGGNNPEPQSSMMVELRALIDLIQAGEFNSATKSFNQLFARYPIIRQSGFGVLLSFANQICRACRQVEVEINWHHNAYENAIQRLGESQQQLQALLVEIIEYQQLYSAVNQDGEISQMHAGLAAPKSSPSISVEEKPPIAHLGLRKSDKNDRDEKKTPAMSSLLIYCLGPFRVFQGDQSIEDWTSSKGKAIFKYLVTHRQRPVAKEVLMDLFWHDSDPDAARNNLNVAIYSLRQTLRRNYPSFSHILFQDDSYLFNPELSIWMDCDAFSDCLNSAKAHERQGNISQALDEYCAAEELYQGEFMEEDRYEDWPISMRESYQNDYLGILERLSRHYFDNSDFVACLSVCRKMLQVDPCREEAHRRLMRCYLKQGQPYLALRQYHVCAEALKNELYVSPSARTIELYNSILH